MKHKIYYSTKNIGRWSADHNDITDHHDIRVWEEAEESLASWTYFHEGCEISVDVSWKAFKDDLEKSLRATREFYKGNTEVIEEQFGSVGKDVVTNCIVDIKGSNKYSDKLWYPAYFASRFAYDFLLMMNLASPGSCNLYLMDIVGDNGGSKRKVKISGYPFETASYSALENRTPHIDFLPLKQVVAWYSSIGVGVKAISESNLEKAIFSMLRVAELDADIVSVVWLFHALESLFDTKVGENFAQLIKRISKLLNLSSAESKKLKRNMRKLYDKRSAIIHGGYEVAHPLSGYVNDERVDKSFVDAMDLVEYGFSIIFTCIQRMVVNNWSSIAFEEKMVGHELDS